MPDNKIDFSATAALRKWPLINTQRVSATFGARPYMQREPDSQRHLYEIQTMPQLDLVSAILLAERIIEFARLKEFHKVGRPDY